MVIICRILYDEVGVTQEDLFIYVLHATEVVVFCEGCEVQSGYKHFGYEVHGHDALCQK
jgi:hypothetical protein